MPEFGFFAHGIPAPGGSKTVQFAWNKSGQLVTRTCPSGKQMPVFWVRDDAGDRNTEWKQNVAIQARSFMRGAKPFQCPIRCRMVFFLLRPMAHFRTGQFRGVLRPDAPFFHTTKPDALKFARSTEDAMTGIVWLDDSSNVSISSEKRYCGPGEKTGCAIRIEPLDPTPQQPTLI